MQCRHPFNIRLLLSLILLSLLSGCDSLPKPQAQEQAQFLLQPNLPTTHVAKTPAMLTLQINPVFSAPGYTGSGMLYINQPNRLQQFAHHRWVAPPARMLETLLQTHLRQSGLFRAVIAQRLHSPSDLRLETELLALHQDFLSSPSRIILNVRFTLIRQTDQHLLASKEVMIREPAAADTPTAGSAAANRTVEKLLNALMEFSQVTLQNLDK